MGRDRTGEREGIQFIVHESKEINGLLPLLKPGPFHSSIMRYYRPYRAQLLTALEPFLVCSLLLDQFAMGDPTGAQGSRQHSSQDSWGHLNLSTTLR